MRALNFVLVAVLATLCGCSLFGRQNSDPINTVPYEKALLAFEAQERHGIEAENCLAEQVLLELEKSECSAAEVDNSIGASLNQTLSAEEWRKEMARLHPLIQELRDHLVWLKGHLDELHKLILTFQKVKGETDYAVSIQVENLERLRESLIQKGLELDKARSSFLEDAERSREPAELSFLGKVGRPLKFAVLGLLLLVGVLGTLYVRMSYGKLLGAGAGVLAVAVVGGFALVAYKEVIIIGALILLGVGTVVGVIWLLLKVFEERRFAQFVDSVREQLPSEYSGKVDELLESVLGEKTAKKLNRVIRVNGGTEKEELSHSDIG